VLAALLGVNIGPNLTYVGSLATLLWRRLLRERDADPPAAEARLRRRARHERRRGRVERLVVEAAEGADLLVWPGQPPPVGSIPPPPPPHGR
jgi:hypothetical protein